jgi:hypothetical protein
MVASNLISARELDARLGNRLQVRLLWCPIEERLWVAVNDLRSGGQFCLEVRDRTQALDVFHHPYAYAAVYGIDTGSHPESETDSVSVAA